MSPTAVPLCQQPSPLAKSCCHPHPRHRPQPPSSTTSSPSTQQLTKAVFARGSHTLLRSPFIVAGGPTDAEVLLRMQNSHVLVGPLRILRESLLQFACAQQCEHNPPGTAGLRNPHGEGNIFKEPKNFRELKNFREPKNSMEPVVPLDLPTCCSTAFQPTASTRVA